MSQTTSKEFSKSNLVGSFYQVAKPQSELKFRPPEIEYDIEELNPYADGEWIKLEPIMREQISTQMSELEQKRDAQESNNRSKIEEDVEVEEGEVEDDIDEGKVEVEDKMEDKDEEIRYKVDRILRGPIWNYGVRKMSADADYYNNVLFGVPWANITTPEDKILRGPKWTPTKPFTSSLACFLLGKMKKIGYGKTALVECDSGRSISYGEMAEKVESLACGLHWIGVQPQQIMAIVSFNSLEAHMMLLACLRIGAIAALVDSSLNPVEMGIALRITSPNLIFTEVGKTLFKVDTAVNYLDMSLHSPKPRLILNTTSMPKSTNYLLFQELLREVNPMEPTPGPRKADPLRPIFILYSGTPENPKACLIAERYYTQSRAFVESVLPESDEPSITILVTPPMYCALSIKTVLNHYTDGQRIIFCRGEIPEPCLITALRKFEVFAFLTIRSTLMALLDWPAKPRCPFLKMVGVTGIPLRLKNLARVNELFQKQAQILQLYGLVETGTTAANTFLENKHGSVGKLFYNVEMKVLEEGTGFALGVYQEGELCIRAPTEMLGYYNNPEANQETIDCEGFIHSGDLGYYDEQGFVHVTDRVREVIKWRTYMVSPSVVEEVLLELPEVKETLVFGLFDEKDGELVSAAVILEAGYEDTDIFELQKQANALLPKHRWLRGGIYVFSRFPRSSTGKPMKSQILKDVMERRGSSQEESAPE